MKTFKDYILESENWPDDLDSHFLQRAMKVTSFNLKPEDFTSLKYKKEIQHIFHINFFPDLDLKHLLERLDKDKLQAGIDALRAEDPGYFEYLYQYNLKGVGPGEAMLYFLLNNAVLGGGSSAGVDLIDPTGKYEVKAVDYSQGFVNNFKLGGTFAMGDIIAGVVELRDKVYGADVVHKEKGGVNMQHLADIQKEYPNELKKYYKIYRDRTHKEYFGNHNFIWLSNSIRKKAGKQLGDILHIGPVKKEDIYFERITSGTIKPKVRING